jgi:cytoskeletal protein RodZ
MLRVGSLDALLTLPGHSSGKDECTLKMEFGTAETNPLTTIEANPARKRALLPVLVVLFLISYALMTMLIVEQGRTIESQRALIHDLFRDSTELSAAKLRSQQEPQARRSQTFSKNPSSQSPSAVTPSTQAPMHQAPSKQSPSSQAVPQNRAQSQRSKSQLQMPARPASDINDAGRSLITI